MSEFEADSLMGDPEFKEWFDSRMEEILFGSDNFSNANGLLSSLHKPESAKLPEKLTRQIRRQQERINTKGREL